MVGEIVTTITDVIAGFLSGIGTGIVDFFTSLFVTAEGALTPFAIMTFVVIGLAFVTGLVAKLMGKF